jgi:minor extracellular serine protease Vpr
VLCKSGVFYTLYGSEKSAPYLAGFPGIRWVQNHHNFSVHPLCLDTARKVMNVNRVNGLDRSLAPDFVHPFRGKNVLIGIIDIEFDTHHPAFLDAQKKTRFIAVWDQDTNVSNRNDFGYGKIKKGQELETDTAFGLIYGQGHGTGMASFAAGSDTSTAFYGIAPEAMLIGVKYNERYVEQDVANALHWIFRIADSLNVPCVVSMSIGLSEGPHDGTSLVDKTIDSLSTPGHIVVGAIGNDGDKRSHIGFSLSYGETKSTWLTMEIDSFKDPPRAQAYSAADIWGEPGKGFSVALNVLDDRTNTYMTSNVSLTTQHTQLHSNEDTLVRMDSLTGAPDTALFFSISERVSSLNQKPHIYTAMVTNNPHLSLGISVSMQTGAPGVVHAWNLVKKAFKSNSIAGFLDGDSISTLNEIGGTGKNTISVGSYISKTKVMTYNGSMFDKKIDDKLGTLCEFSGRGPSVDGRNKPDITAPGDMVVGAMSRRDPYNSQTVLWPDSHINYGRYVRGTGTSVSSPLVAGIVALLLEAKPRLTVDSAKMLLNSTAIKDDFTGALTTVDNSWGSGKVSAYGALAKLLGVAGNLKPDLIKNKSMVKPAISITANGRFLLIVFPDKEKTFAWRVFVNDCAGRKILDISGKQRIALPAGLSKGVYFASVTGEGRSAISKLTIVR